MKASYNWVNLFQLKEKCWKIKQVPCWWVRPNINKRCICLKCHFGQTNISSLISNEVRLDGHPTHMYINHILGWAYATFWFSTFFHLDEYNNPVQYNFLFVCDFSYKQHFGWILSIFFKTLLSEMKGQFSNLKSNKPESEIHFQNWLTEHEQCKFSEPSYKITQALCLLVAYPLNPIKTHK